MTRATVTESMDCGGGDSSSDFHINCCVSSNSNSFTSICSEMFLFQCQQLTTEKEYSPYSNVYSPRTDSYSTETELGVACYFLCVSRAFHFWINGLKLLGYFH